MTQMTENPKPESNREEKLVEVASDAQYKKRFKEAVADAQHLLMYASSTCPNDIDRGTLEKLISARRRIENNEPFSPQEESDFWLAYQDIWKLVQPVTAESIKANIPAENTNVSKARGTVNRHITFTIITLIFLLIFQIYWVIGNQLTTQAAELSQKEADLTLELSENQQEYSRIEIRYKQTEMESENFSGAYNFYYTPEWERDILDSTIKRADLEKQLELLKSQLERSSAILGVWSGPWKWLIDENPECVEGETNECIQVDLPFNEEYASQFYFIDNQIQAIEDQIRSDPTGMQEAENQIFYLTTDATSIQGQLDSLNQQYSDLDSQARVLQEKLNRIDQKAVLEERLTTLTITQSEIQNQINTVNTQLSNLPADADANARSDLETQLNELATALANVQLELTDVNNQLSAFSSEVSETRGQVESELNSIVENRTSVLDQIQYLQSQMQYYIVDPEELAKQIVANRELAKSQWENERKIWERREKADADREKTRREQFQNQLAGQFVLVVLQSYLLPLLYGILGARTSVLRTLSKQVEQVTFSESAGIQHVLRISLGALAGIMVGWFSFLIDSSTFFGSVSPLAIAFLVGYNIEVFFSFMDNALNKIRESSQQNTQTSETTEQPQSTNTVSQSLPPQETQSGGTPASEPAAG